MARKYSTTPIGQTYSIAKDVIDSGTIEFYMRNKTQEEYNPQYVQFSDDKYRIPYILRDMATLCTSIEVGYFISDIARRMTHKNPSTSHYEISTEELEYVSKFIRNGIKGYKESKYINLNELV